MVHKQTNPDEGRRGRRACKIKTHSKQLRQRGWRASDGVKGGGTAGHGGGNGGENSGGFTEGRNGGGNGGGNSGGFTETKQRSPMLSPSYATPTLSHVNQPNHQHDTNDRMINAMADLQMKETTQQFKSLNSLY